MTQVNGWYLPKGDRYFPQFLEGPPRKSNGFQREHLLKAFEFVKDWNIAIDVGAHVGFWTLDMAERFERVYAFEPSPDTFRCLRMNMIEIPNVVLSPTAIGDKPGVGRVREHAQGNTGSRYVVVGDRPGEETVPIVTLDELNFPTCDLLKIDVEGFEFQVLQGADELITKHQPVVIMECDKRFSKDRYGVPNTAAEMLLLQHGYKVAAHMRPDKVFVAT